MSDEANAHHEHHRDTPPRARRRLPGRCGGALLLTVGGLVAFAVGALMGGVFEGTNVSPAPVHALVAEAGTSGAVPRLPSLPGGREFALTGATPPGASALGAAQGDGAPETTGGASAAQRARSSSSAPSANQTTFAATSPNSTLPSLTLQEIAAALRMAPQSDDVSAVTLPCGSGSGSGTDLGIGVELCSSS